MKVLTLILILIGGAIGWFAAGEVAAVEITYDSGLR